MREGPQRKLHRIATREVAIYEAMRRHLQCGGLPPLSRSQPFRKPIITGAIIPSSPPIKVSALLTSK